MLSLCLPLTSSRKSPCAACSPMLLCVVHGLNLHLWFHGPCVCLGGCQQCQQCLFDNSPVAVTKPLPLPWTQARSRATHQHPFVHPLHLKLLELHGSQSVFFVATGWLPPLMQGTHHPLAHSPAHLCWEHSPVFLGSGAGTQGQAGGCESRTGHRSSVQRPLEQLAPHPGPEAKKVGEQVACRERAWLGGLSMTRSYMMLRLCREGRWGAGGPALRRLSNPGSGVGHSLWARCSRLALLGTLSPCGLLGPSPAQPGAWPFKLHPRALRECPSGAHLSLDSDQFSLSPNPPCSSVLSGSGFKKVCSVTSPLALRKRKRK